MKRKAAGCISSCGAASKCPVSRRLFGLENRREPSLIVSSHIGLTAMGIRWEHNRSIGFLALRMPGGVWNCAGDVSKERLLVCGPSQIQVLRGQLLGRDVALICCSEAHEDAIDLTRKDAIVDQYEDWIPLPNEASAGFEPRRAWKSKKGITEGQAKKWAEDVLDEAEEESEEEADKAIRKEGAVLVFLAAGSKGSGHLFLRSEGTAALPDNAVAFQWGDLDTEARNFAQRRRAGQDMAAEELDQLLGKRKEDRRREGLELFDDWLIRQVQTGDVPVEVVLESPVPADQVELHRLDPVVACGAHACLRAMELDSDSDSEDENDGGSDAFIDYLRRRLAAEVPSQLHFVDCRELGEGSEDKTLRDSFQQLWASGPPRKDPEEEELEAADEAEDEEEGEPGEPGEGASSAPVPSFEAFFGAASDVLYYHPEVKVDYVPFLSKCVRSPEALQRFFEHLFFSTVPDALAELRLDVETRPFARIRSLIYQPASQNPTRRPRERPRIPVKVLPEDCFLGDPGPGPRTWLSALCARVAAAGGERLVAAARDAYRQQVQYLLADPKMADQDGDYFEAWLRECHPNIYEDVDTSDPAELIRRDWMPSESKPKSKKHRHQLRDITIPCVEDAFKELLRFDPGRVSTRRERVLGQILVDVYMLCMVDVAIAVKAVELALKTEAGPLVLVLYAGGDHIRKQVMFFEAQGFTSKGLAEDGLFGKEDYEDFEPRGLKLPSCLHDLRELFPALKRDALSSRAPPKSELRDGVCVFQAQRTCKESE
ncbi:unnamed protein product [Effrenium voratum]|nr:unnamed protein product [Effrenium voratum]